ncbi:MAG: MaoC family dehydratase N-terminal domain-containing protein [Deltaproteobacteria bacterium]|nr:MaoC family dehydratase N-terminal domain-containing protein [Deltaproteobacteria bacterium]MBI3296045.1 MaoC family dehydratase N-terminal domain-containing protein [Deltaproteobacteria bacterium]
MTYVVGEAIPATLKGEITREQLRAYADASGDINPIHLNEKFAKEAGFPSVIAHGMLSAAFLGDYILEHFPENTFRLEKFKVRFKKITLPGDLITCVGKIKSIDKERSIIATIATTNQKGEETTSGEATLSTIN